MCGAYRRDLLQGSRTSRVTNEASFSQFPISVEPLNHFEGVGTAISVLRLRSGH
jgi:hypothetical protein